MSDNSKHANGVFIRGGVRRFVTVETTRQTLNFDVITRGTIISATDGKVSGRFGEQVVTLGVRLGPNNHIRVSGFGENAEVVKGLPELVKDKKYVAFKFVGKLMGREDFQPSLGMNVLEIEGYTPEGTTEVILSNPAVDTPGSTMNAVTEILA